MKSTAFPMLSPSGANYLRKDELHVNLGWYQLNGISSAETALALPKNIPSAGNFVYLNDQAATVFVRPTQHFSVIHIRRKRRKPLSKQPPLTTEQKISGLRRVLKKHIKKADFVELVDEPDGVEVRSVVKLRRRYKHSYIHLR